MEETHLPQEAREAGVLFDLSGKIALITGGSRGLGKQMALSFAANGADVIIASRKLENCEAVAAEIRAMGRRASAYAVHAGRWAEMDALMDRAYADYGRIDILVNNAGMSPNLPSHEVSEAAFDSVVNLNFKGPFRLASQVAHRMSQSGGGVIINISSSGALLPLPGAVPYGAAKAALNAMTASLAREYGPSVRVNAISAGPFLTDIAKAWAPDMHLRAANSLQRPGQPEEIIGAALYLASNAGRFTTGSVLRVDGGMV